MYGLYVLIINSFHTKLKITTHNFHGLIVLNFYIVIIQGALTNCSLVINLRLCFNINKYEKGNKDIYESYIKASIVQ